MKKVHGQELFSSAPEIIVEAGLLDAPGLFERQRDLGVRVGVGLQQHDGDVAIFVDQLGVNRAEGVDLGGGPEDADAGIDGVDDLFDRDQAAGGVGVAVDGDFDIIKGVFDGEGHIDLHAVPVSLDREMILSELNSQVNRFRNKYHFSGK